MSFDGTLFVVDDDVASALSLKALLGAYEFNVKLFDCAEDFLEAFDGRSKSCLVLDLRLPGMSGLDLQNELAQRDIRLPIVMISGHADEQSHAQAIRNGAAAFLQKPFSGKELCQAIWRAIGATT